MGDNGKLMRFYSFKFADTPFLPIAYVEFKRFMFVFMLPTAASSM